MNKYLVKVDEILDQRYDSYGSIEDNMESFLRLEEAWDYTCAQNKDIPRPVQGIVKMMLMKFSRIPGKPTYEDTYDDIIGYSVLLRESIERQNDGVDENVQQDL